MADDKAERGPADRSRINIREDYELEYWSRKLSCNRAELRAAVDRVGVMVKEVQDELDHTRKR